MKQNKTIFTCDQCSKKTEIKSNQSYPYFSGWNYIYNLEFKLTPKETYVKDKHFCCKDCLKTYLIKFNR